jgi:hypothetical protein
MPLFQHNIGLEPSPNPSTWVTVTPNHGWMFGVTGETIDFPVTNDLGQTKYHVVRGEYLYTLSGKILSGEIDKIRVGPMASMFGATVKSISTLDKVPVPRKPVAPETMPLPAGIWCISDGLRRWYLDTQYLEYFAQNKPGQGDKLLLQWRGDHCFIITPRKTDYYSTFADMWGDETVKVLSKNRLIAGNEFLLSDDDDSYRAEEIRYDNKYSYAAKSNWQILVNNANGKSIKKPNLGIE